MDMKKTMDALKRLGYETSYFEAADEAAAYLDGKIDNKTVGFGDSETLQVLKLYELLSMHNQVTDPMHCQEGSDFWKTARLCLGTEVFLTSVNAIAETGEMVNIDGTGNRVAGSLFGHEKVYFVAGINKIEPTLEKAIWRARNIAAPMNAKRHGYNTPCAVNGDRCYDCSSPDRICCGEIIYRYKMRFIDMEVVLIGESLGL